MSTSLFLLLLFLQAKNYSRGMLNRVSSIKITNINSCYKKVGRDVLHVLVYMWDIFKESTIFSKYICLKNIENLWVAKFIFNFYNTITTNLCSYFERLFINAPFIFYLFIKFLYLIYYFINN